MQICIDTNFRRAGQQGPTRTLTAALGDPLYAFA